MPACTSPEPDTPRPGPPAPLLHTCRLRRQRTCPGRRTARPPRTLGPGAARGHRVGLHAVRGLAEGLGELGRVERQDARPPRCARPRGARRCRRRPARPRRPGTPDGATGARAGRRSARCRRTRADEHGVGTVREVEDHLSVGGVDVAVVVGAQRRHERLRHGDRQRGGDEAQRWRPGACRLRRAGPPHPRGGPHRVLAVPPRTRRRPRDSLSLPGSGSGQPRSRLRGDGRRRGCGRTPPPAGQPSWLASSSARAPPWWAPARFSTAEVSAKRTSSTPSPAAR